MTGEYRIKYMQDTDAAKYKQLPHKEVTILDFNDPKDKVKYGLAVTLANDPTEQMSILQNLSNDKFQFYKDNNNNPIIELNGNPLYLNRKGLSAADFRDFAIEAGMFLPAAGLAGRGATLAGRTLLAGSGVGATELMRDIGSKKAGGDLDPLDWLGGAVAGAGGQLGGELLIGKLFRAVTENWN